MTIQPLLGTGLVPLPRAYLCKWVGPTHVIWLEGWAETSCVCVCVCVCVCLPSSPALLGHGGWILPSEIPTFWIRVFSPSKCTYVVSDIMAITSYWHLGDNKSISSVAGDSLCGADPSGPRSVPCTVRTLSHRALQGEMGRWAAILDVLSLSLINIYMFEMCLRWLMATFWACSGKAWFWCWFLIGNQFLMVLEPMNNIKEYLRSKASTWCSRIQGTWKGSDKIRHFPIL